MSNPTFGISITRIDNEPRPAVYSDMSVVGLIGTAPEADAAVFPLDTPIFMYSDDSVKRTALGTQGTSHDALTLHRGYQLDGCPRDGCAHGCAIRRNFYTSGI